MEDLQANQQQIVYAMEQLLSNFKKDGADRRTAAHIKKRLDTLDSYWQEFHNLHLQVRELCDEHHPYIVQNQYGQVLEFYTKTKEYIQSFLPTEQKSRPSTPLIKPSTFNPLPSTSATPRQVDRSVDSKLDEMLRKQTSNFRAFERTLANIDVDLLIDNWELEDALKTLKARWDAIDSLHWELDSELDGTNEAYEQQFSTHEKTFSNMKKAINKKIWSTAHQEKSTPKLEIPIFNGNYHQWVPFKDLFTESIHNNRSLSNAQKMQFLKSKVRGEAERLIQHLQISSDNYVICWEILNNRYNNQKLIFTSHMNILTSLPVVQQASIANIKKIHDTTLECLNAIKNLGVDISTWDPIIVYLLTQKLDNETHHDYIQSLKCPRELPKLQDFLEFLELTFTSLESARKKQESTHQKSNISSNQNQHLKTPKSTYFKQSYASNRLTTQRSSNIPSRNATSLNSQAAKNKNFITYTCPLCSKDHGLFFCQEFLDMSPQTRRKTVTKLNVCQNCLFSHQGKACISEKRCRECNENHNTVLHDAFNSYSNKPQSNAHMKNTSSMSSEAEHNRVSISNSNVAQQNNDMTEILLATAVLKVRAADGTYKIMRALIDQGSQVSIISENAAQRLTLPRRTCKGSIFGVGVKPNSCKGVLDISCSSMDNYYVFDTSVFIMQNLIKQLPNATFTKPSWSFLNNIQLADPDFNISRPVDILLGADIYSQIILPGICQEDQSVPIAQQTRLGWILCGSTKTYQCNVILNNIEQIEKFWETEDITEHSNLSTEDLQCIQYYEETTKRLTDGRYEVRLPLKPGYEQQLGSSKNKAIAQFLNMERKFRKSNSFGQNYKAFIHEYLALGHLKPAESVGRLECYLPHHGVERPESTTTALRVVFNGSCKTSTGSSLNDVMYAGPNLQQDLQELLIKWRQFEIVFTADIEKMFRQIWIHQDDQQLQKIIWRDYPSSILQEFQLCTVTYGTKAAPFLAMMTLKRLANDERNNYSNTAIQALEEAMYTDDLLFGAPCMTSAIELQKELILLLQSGGFNLRKWNSNKEELLNINKNQHNKNFDFKHAHSSKTLGLSWISKQDTFTFQSKISDSEKVCTKRSLLSEISKQFDPIGLIAPVTLKLKLLFQRVWQLNLQWDDELPEDIQSEWINMKNDIKMIDQLQIPRWLGTKQKGVVELHGYCDSSEKAFSCVVYCKTNRDQQAIVVLVAAKTRLVPIKTHTTIPRLELNAAVLLSKLMNKVVNCLSSYNIQIFGWCDSTAVLGWLHGDVARWKPFVANRVKQVTTTMPPACWRYVKSEENPADCASRGLTATQLKDHPLWWQGPSWLLTYKQDKENRPIYTTNEEEKQVLVAQKTVEESYHILQHLIEKQSSFTRLVRILAWTLRVKKDKTKKRQPYLTISELQTATNLFIKYVQSTEFQEDINNIIQSKQVSKKSTLSKLNPFIDRSGILRVDGRLEFANITYNMKHPIILPNNSRFTQLLIYNAHKITFHGGARLTSAFIRQKYWIVGGNRTIKSLLRTCVTCRRHEPSIQPQIMGNLIEARANPSRAFYNAGVDYTGYVDVKASKGRGIITTKGYVAVFVCMATKAVHLELVSDLTSSAFLAALRRMSARRGAPRHIYCDNGSNFVCASRILKQTTKQSKENHSDVDFLSELTKMEVEFHFNAPSWPSAGGLWEAAVKSLKYHIKRVIGEQKLTFEEYSTILTQLEACLNTRPLCALTEDVEDLDFLTPSHFLTGTADVTILETEHDARTRWHLTEKLMADIWKRWKSEYLTQLTVRSKWRQSTPNIQVGQLVTVQDDHLPAGKWLTGRVIELHPGKDGFVRVVSLKTKNGILKRPVSKLSILPLHQINEPEIRKNKITTKTSLVSICAALLFFLSIIVPTHCAYSIQQLNQSLYFDAISNIQLIRDDWKLIIYYDMQPFWEGSEALYKYQKHLENICETMKSDGNCDAILLQLRHSISELEYYNGMLLGKSTEHDRQKRGLINGVGYLANTLFGVLDDHFAEKYERDISLVRQNEHHLASLFKNQTSIIEAEYNMMQRMEEVMRKQHKLINKQISALDSNINKLRKELEKLHSFNQFLALSVIANNLLLNLKSIQNTMTDAITDTYHGRFDMHLISPTQLKNELSMISGQIPKDLTLPITTIQTDFQKIYHFLQVKTKLTDKYLIFEVRLPLVSRDNYNLYRVIPIPHKRRNSFVNIIPIADYIAINLEKDTYIPMTSIDLQECLLYEFSAHLCHLKHPIYQRNSDDNLCLKNNNTNQCQINIAECNNMFIQLNKVNNYLFTTCDKCNVRVLCGDQVTVEQLREAGVIALEPGCTIKSEGLSIYTHKLFTSELTTGPEIYAPKIAPINQIIKLSIPELENLEKDSDNFQANLTTLNENIKNLKMQSQDVIAENISFHDIHHYVAIYILMGVAVLVAISLACKRLRKRRNMAITSSISLDNITTEGENSAPVTAVAAPRVQRAAAVPAPRKQPAAASAEHAASPAVPNTQDRATSPIFRTLIFKHDED